MFLPEFNIFKHTQANTTLETFKIIVCIGCAASFTTFPEKKKELPSI